MMTVEQLLKGAKAKAKRDRDEYRLWFYAQPKGVQDWLVEGNPNAHPDKEDYDAEE